MGLTIWQFLSDRADKMARDAFKGVDTIDDWKRIRSLRHREFLRSMGLDPMPVRPDPKVADYGSFAGDGFRSRKIGFQIMPDCWSSANVYYPDPAPAEPAPGVLYVCGHAAIGTWAFQSHPIVWARRGYVCLIVDTIEQNDNPGEHHGALMGWNDAWLSMGYTSAGGEALNAIRALDVLAEDPAVDPARLGVTGVSGGGACSFHVAMLDERVKAVSTLCGISSPRDAIQNQTLYSHCSCMFPYNVHRRDISEYAALIAPRAALFCFADHDGLFLPSETTGLVERAKRIFSLYDLEDHCGLVTCPGGHGDHVEFDEATQRWFDWHVAGDERPILKRGEREVEETTTCVFKGSPPTPNYLSVLPELISPRGTLVLPENADEWEETRRNALESLHLPVFDGEASMEAIYDWRTNQARRGRIDGVDVWLAMEGARGRSAKIVVSVANEGANWRQAMYRLVKTTDSSDLGQLAFQPRVAGGNLPVDPPNDFPPGSRVFSPHAVHIQAMAITGFTPAMMTIDDLGVLLDDLFELDEMKGRELYLYGRRTAGVASLYKALLDERVAGVVVEDIPSSLLHGCPIIGAARAFDVQHAVGLMAPRKVALVNPGHCNWTWPDRVFKRLGCPESFINTCDATTAFDRILAD